MKPTGDLAHIVALARTAGEELLRHFRAERLEVSYKGPRDLVTRADRQSEEVIVSGLRERFPADQILAEEGGAQGRAGGRTWIVDPLDGTTNFAHGHPLFSISIGLWDRDRPRLGVVHVPVLKECFWAAEGRGAYRNGRRLRVAPETRLDRSLLATGFSYSRREVASGALDLFAQLLERSREVRRGGSACLDLAYTAAGIFGGFWEFFLKPHDVGAGALLVAEAGGVVTDVRGSDDYLFGGSIVAAAPEIHRQLLEVLRGGPPHPGA